MREPNRAVFLLSLLVLTLLLASLGKAYAQSSSSVERISVEDARSRVLAGKAFLVCAYNEERCSGMMLEGALTKTQFEKKLATLPKDQEIITYCS